MRVAELLGSFSLEMQIIVGGLMLLGFVLGGVLLSGLGIKRREAAHDANELKVLLDRAVSALEERKAKDRKAVLSLRQKPVRRLVIRKNSAVRNAVRWSEGRAFGPRR